MLTGGVNSRLRRLTEPEFTPLRCKCKTEILGCGHVATAGNSLTGGLTRAITTTEEIEEIMDTREAYQTQSFFTPGALFGGARKLLRTMRFLLTAPLSLIILLALTIPSLAQSALTDDATVSTFNGGANHGSNPNLSVSHRENIYLRFNLSSTLPAATPGSEIRRATLKLYAGHVKTAGKL